MNKEELIALLKEKQALLLAERKERNKKAFKQKPYDELTPLQMQKWRKKKVRTTDRKTSDGKELLA